jgi:uncharacterized iron-regulated membrane protein
MKPGAVIALCIAVLLAGCGGGLILGSFFGVSSQLATDLIADMKAQAADTDTVTNLEAAEGVSVAVEFQTIPASGDPHTVRAGDQFTLTVRIRETSGNSRMIRAVVFDAQYLENFGMGRAEPTPELLQFLGDQRSFSFLQSIDPYGESVFTLRLIALLPGEFSGRVLVDIDGAEAHADVQTLVTAP